MPWEQRLWPSDMSCTLRHRCSASAPRRSRVRGRRNGPEAHWRGGATVMAPAAGGAHPSFCEGRHPCDGGRAPSKGAQIRQRHARPQAGGQRVGARLRASRPPSAEPEPAANEAATHTACSGAAPPRSRSCRCTPPPKGAACCWAWLRGTGGGGGPGGGGTVFPYHTCILRKLRAAEKKGNGRDNPSIQGIGRKEKK